MMSYRCPIILYNVGFFECVLTLQADLSTPFTFSLLVSQNVNLKKNREMFLICIFFEITGLLLLCFFVFGEASRPGEPAAQSLSSLESMLMIQQPQNDRISSVGLNS